MSERYILSSPVPHGQRTPAGHHQPTLFSKGPTLRRERCREKSRPPNHVRVTVLGLSRG